MAYDAARSQTVLFGGVPEPAAQPLTDTWTWDANDWTQQHPAQSPPADSRIVGETLVYDSARQVVVGPVTLSAHYALTRWSWDGTNWMQQIAGFEGQVVADDAAKGVLIAFAGESRTDYDETGIEEWDGHTWSVKGVWREPTVLDAYATSLAAGIAGVEARTGFPYANSGCFGGQPCLQDAEVISGAGSAGTSTQVSIRVRTSGFWPGFTCTATVTEQSSGWHFQFPVICG